MCTPTLLFHKYVVYGGEKVGKTSFQQCLSEDEFCESYTPTIGCEVRVKSYSLDNIHCKSQIWTTSGQGKMMTISRAFLRGCSGEFDIFFTIRPCTQ